jgi:uncharacterized membrane protein
MTKVRLTYTLALLGYFGVVITILVWNLGLRPAGEIPLYVVLAFLLIPLAFPLAGLVRGKPYTHAWSTFMAIYYFVVGIWISGGEDTRWYGTAIGLCSVLWFLGSMFYTRAKARALRSAGS